MAENNENKLVNIEEKIKERLNGDAQNNALDFVAFLRANAISLDYNASESGYGGWNGAVGGIVGNSIGYATFNGDEQGVGPWTFWLNSCDFDGSSSADEDFKNAIWAFASPCGHCNENWEKCMGSGKKTILGKEFENQCHSPLMFTNPDAKTLENMKKFLLYLKPEIDSIQTEIKREKAEHDVLADKQEEPKSEQEKKLTLDEQINSKLSGDIQKNALDFVAYMRAAGMMNDSTHSTAFTYNGRWVCILIIYEGGWTIYDNPLCGREDNFPVDEYLKEFAWEHVNICGKCGCPSKPGTRKTIFGKEFDNVCTSEVAFDNPDPETLKKVMRLIDIWKQGIDDSNKTQRI